MKYVKTKETLRNLILSLSAMLFMLNAQSVWAVDCAEWNLAKDFRVSPNQENPNRDSCGNLGVWHFMQSGDFNRTPSTYTLMQNFTTDFVGTHNLQAWGGTERDNSFINGYMPNVVINNTGGVLAGVSLDKVNIHPGWTKLVVVGWRSPISGNVVITGSIADTNNSCGDGIRWFIDKNSVNLATGSFAEGGSQLLQNIGNAISNIPVQQGDFLYFVVHPNISSYCDTTMLDVTIKSVGNVCVDSCKTNPASCGLFTQAQIDAAKQACKADPASCGIIVSPSPDQCKTNPASCGLFTQAQIDAAKQACKTDPASCGLFTQAQIDAAKQAAIAQCKTTPASCGITLIDNNGSTQVGIDQCKANPASCGITKLDGISTNAFITPANKMIAGVLISGGTKRLMVRASSIDGMVDPQLDIVTYPDRKPLGSNDSWATDPAAAELTQKKLAPGRATDAATIINLPPGLFTMEITSKNGGSGAGIIEVYDMAVFP